MQSRKTIRWTKAQRQVFSEMGKVGGKNKAAKMTAEARTALAKKMVAARWKKAKAREAVA